MKALAEVKQYLRLDKFPHIWCSGCGHGIILQSFIRAVLDLDVDRDKLVVVSGIGCSSRAVGYIDFDTLHTAHGRSVAFATGIKMAKPEFTVVALVGDGDISAIGGNHLIHAARRNIDITVVVFNNYNYGMTGGQNSPTTRADDYTVTTPYGNIERPFDLCALAKAAGATYIARSTTYHAVGLPKLIADGIRHHGFSLIEIITGCPTYYGRMNKMDDGVKMLEWQRDHAINLKQSQALSEEEKKGKFVIGLIHLGEEPEYTDEYLKIIQKAQGKTA
ncbi:MAG: thiamine pyrophosphate-dependent enzyme [Candidatus Omnitrophota bacterium]|nr:thiamine pyrophosphate-dependent enzyme [Candidatus Omnitrophota bacterium]